MPTLIIVTLIGPLGNTRTALPTARITRVDAGRGGAIIHTTEDERLSVSESFDDVCLLLSAE